MSFTAGRPLSASINMTSTAAAGAAARGRAGDAARRAFFGRGAARRATFFATFREAFFATFFAGRLPRFAAFFAPRRGEAEDLRDFALFLRAAIDQPPRSRAASGWWRAGNMRPRPAPVQAKDRARARLRGPSAPP